MMTGLERQVYDKTSVHNPDGKGEHTYHPGNKSCHVCQELSKFYEGK